MFIRVLLLFDRVVSVGVHRPLFDRALYVLLIRLCCKQKLNFAFMMYDFPIPVQ